MRLPPARLSLLLVLAAALLAHARGLAGGFVHDDHRFIEQNAALGEVRPWDYLVDPGTASAASGEGIRVDIYRPLRTLLFALEAAVFDGPSGWHVVSALLHAVNAGFVLLLLRSLLRAEGPAVLGALLFAVHPVTVESVAWVSSQGDLLALTLTLLTLRVLERPGTARTLLGVALGALACLAKESAVVLPALLLLRDRALPDDARPAWRTTLVRTAVLALVVVGYFALRAAVLPGDLAQVEDPGLAEKARGFLAATTWYAGALLWPSGFRFETDLLAPLSWGEPAVVLGLGIWLTVAAVGVVGWRRGRPTVVAFAALAAAAALVPVSQVFVPLKTLAAERFLYPVLPFAVAAAAAGALALGRRLGPAWAWAPCLLAVPLAAVTVARTAAWEDEEALWRAVRADRPWNARAFEGLGFALLQKGRFRDAERAYTSYFEANPFDGKARYVFAGHLRSLADRLAAMRHEHDPEAVRQSDLFTRRAQVLALTMAEYGAALSVWDEVGLAAGRGSAAMREESLKRLAQAGFELYLVAEEKGSLEGVPALERARWANDRLIALSGVDPDKPADVAAKAPFANRRFRWMLAWFAVTAPIGADQPQAYRELLRFRQAALAALGLDADQANDVQVRLLEPLLDALLVEQEAAYRDARAPAERRRSAEEIRTLTSARVELLERTGREREARRLIEEFEKRWR